MITTTGGLLISVEISSQSEAHQCSAVLATKNGSPVSKFLGLLVYVFTA